MKALLEVDVTEGRRRMRELRRAPGAPAVSFTAWIAACVAAAAAENAHAYAMYAGGRARAVFDTVDIALPVERAVPGEPVPLPLRIADAGSKTVGQISAEIRTAQEEGLHTGQVVLGQARPPLVQRLSFRLPGFLRRPAMKALLRSPSWVKHNMGTVHVTSLASFGSSRGWVIPLSVAPLCVARGSVSRQPAVVGSELGIREILCLTVLLDHDVIDGAPAARFVSRLARLIESGHGL